MGDAELDHDHALGLEQFGPAVHRVDPARRRPHPARASACPSSRVVTATSAKVSACRSSSADSGPVRARNTSSTPRRPAPTCNGNANTARTPASCAAGRVARPAAHRARRPGRGPAPDGGRRTRRCTALRPARTAAPRCARRPGRTRSSGRVHSSLGHHAQPGARGGQRRHRRRAQPLQEARHAVPGVRARRLLRDERHHPGKLVIHSTHRPMPGAAPVLPNRWPAAAGSVHGCTFRGGQVLPRARAAERRSSVSRDRTRTGVSGGYRARAVGLGGTGQVDQVVRTVSTRRASGGPGHR